MHTLTIRPSDGLQAAIDRLPDDGQPAVPTRSLRVQGRPWREFAKTVLLECFIGPHIRPEGWNDWGKTDFTYTGLFAEYGCHGPGSDTSARADFSRTLTPEEAAAVTYADLWNSL